jgi:hypothetical protein
MKREGGDEREVVEKDIQVVTNPLSPVLFESSVYIYIASLVD